MEEQHAMWLNILKWSLKQSDGTTATELKPLSDDDKVFLKSVFDEITKDEPNRLQIILKTFQDIISLHTEPISESKSNHDESIDEDNLEDLLQELRDIVEQIDMSHVFVKFGGLTVLLAIIQFPLFSNNIKSLAAGTIATISQNHTVVQDLIYEQQTLDTLCHIFLNVIDSNALSAKVKSSLHLCICNNLLFIGFTSNFINYSWT